MHLGHSTVAQHLKRFKDAEKGCKIYQAPHNYKLTPAIKKQLLHAIETKKLATLTDMLQWLKDHKNIVVRRNTLRTSLKRWGCHAYIPQRKPLLTDSTREDRVARCTEWRRLSQNE